MAVRLDRPWLALSRENVAAVAGHLGVYEIADAAGRVVYIGAAGGRSRFGLKGELEAWVAEPREGASTFRFEVNTMYWSRWRELLQAHVHDHGALPPGNRDVDPRSLGRLRPDGPGRR